MEHKIHTVADCLNRELNVNLNKQQVLASLESKLKQVSIKISKSEEELVSKVSF
jgi:hypothetical protein